MSQKAQQAQSVLAQLSTLLPALGNALAEEVPAERVDEASVYQLL